MLIPFIGEWYLEAKSGCGVLTAPGVSLLLGPLQGLGTTCMYMPATELGTTYVYTNMLVIPMNLCFCVSIFIYFKLNMSSY